MRAQERRGTASRTTRRPKGSSNSLICRSAHLQVTITQESLVHTSTPAATCWHPLPPAGICCHLLAPAGTCWHLLPPAGTRWHPLAPAGTCWHPLAPAGTCWHPLAPAGTRWHLLAQQNACACSCGHKRAEHRMECLLARTMQASRAAGFTQRDQLSAKRVQL
eukprot:1147905-Pelagomonas_calceolata.AAC.1